MIAEQPGPALGASDWITVDQERIDQFAACTGDMQWIHVDRERAQRESPFGTTIAHGFLTLSLVAPTVLDALVVPDGAQVVNYGLERVRFVAPVPSGSRVRNIIVLLSEEVKGPNRRLLTIQSTMEIEGSDKPALVAISLIMLSQNEETGG